MPWRLRDSFEVNPEQGIALEGIEVVVQVDVVLITQVSGTFAPGASILLMVSSSCTGTAMKSQGADQGASEPVRYRARPPSMKDHVRAGLASAAGG